VDGAARQARLQKTKQPTRALARQHSFTVQRRGRRRDVEHVGMRDLDRGLAAVRQLDHQPQPPKAGIHAPRAQRPAAQRMLTGNHPHHSRKPAADMVQCEANSKGDWPHLTEIRDPAALDSELARIRTEYNTRRLHASIGYVTPDDEHHGRGPGIRRGRAAGLKRARAERIEQNRASKR